MITRVNVLSALQTLCRCIWSIGC